MVMRRRLAARRIGDDRGDEALAWNVRNRLAEGGTDRAGWRLRLRHTGTTTDAVSKADNANIGRVTTCIRMITLLSPVGRQGCAKRHIRSRADHPLQGRGTVRKLFLLDRILIEAPNVYGLRHG